MTLYRFRDMLTGQRKKDSKAAWHRQPRRDTQMQHRRDTQMQHRRAMRAYKGPQ